MGTATFLGYQPRLRNPNPNRPDSRRRRQIDSPHAHRRCAASPNSSPAKNLVMGQVRILKRGEPLVSAGKREAAPRAGRRNPVPVDPELSLGSTDRLGPEPELVRFQIRVGDLRRVVDVTYAGSGFVSSPPPSSVPFPGFLGKKKDA